LLEVKIEAVSPYGVSLAIAIASSSLLTSMTLNIGPKISSFALLSFFETSKTIGDMNGPPGIFLFI